MPDSTEYRDGDFATFSQFHQTNPAWTEASLRWLRFNEATNGAKKAGVFVEQGRRVLIYRPAFFRLLAGGRK